MQNAVINFAKSKEHGLCLIDMPTGTGKTYQAKELIKRIIKGETLNSIDLVIFLTPLRKNIDDIYNDLKKDFEDNLELFYSNVLRIYSNYECVLDNLIEIENTIPSNIRKKESFKLLKNKIETYKELEKQNYLSKDILETTKKEIRTSYEPQFRHDIENELNKIAKTKSEKLKLIKHEYKWIKVLYPSCLTENKKVLFMTMDKFLFGNDPIISNSYKFLSYSKIKNSLIFIDEFDATKDVILNQEIEKCTDYKIDLVKLFSSIASSLKGINVPESIFASSDDSKISFNKMKDVILNIDKQYNLNYIFKLESDENNDRYFLFDDYQIHTISNGKDDKYISIKNDDKKNQNTILISAKKDDGFFYRAIYGMKGALNYFIHCCSILAKNYLSHHNELAIINHTDKMEIEQAVSTIIYYFNLDTEIANVVTSLVLDDNALPQESRKRDLFSTDFYMNGFRYYDFNDDISHDVSTVISMCYLNNTPEKFIISLSSKARVIGLSATASINSVTGNYNLDYVKSKLKDDYYLLPNSEQEQINKYINEQLKCNYSINVNTISLPGQEPEDICDHLFNKSENIEYYLDVFKENLDDDSKNPNYDNARFAKVLSSVKLFMQNKDSRVMLVLTNRNVKKYEQDLYSNIWLNEFINKFSKELLVDEPKVHCLFGSDFDKEKELYKQEIIEGHKIILFSSYPSVGTGQNLQYDLIDEENLKSQKDIDTIYVELPTNIIVHNKSLKEEGNLNKYIYQMEALRANGEISPYSSLFNIKSAFKQYMSMPDKKVTFDYLPYKSSSTNNHIVKILVQAIGRICRTRNKDVNHKVNIYLDDEIIKTVDFNFMKIRSMNPEFKKIVDLSKIEQKYDIESVINLNKAIDCNLRVKKRIDVILDNNKIKWNIDDMIQWNRIRIFILKHPTISIDELDRYSKEDGFESIKDFYLYAKKGQKMYEYLYNDESETKWNIRYGQEKDAKPGDIVIGAKSARLFEILSNVFVRDYFKKNGYALKFEPNECIILPVVFQNIYKGALGEIAGKVILESYGIKLKEIDDPNKFEKFDYCCADNPNVYIDFKNWSDKDSVNEREYRLHSQDKLNLIEGKKGFIINIIADEFNMFETDDIITISTLYKYKDGKYYDLTQEKAKITSKLLEAIKDGNK